MVELCLCLVLLLVLPRFGLRNLETRINVALGELFLTITWGRLAIHVSLLRLVVKFTIEDIMTIKLSMNNAALERPLTGVFVGHAEFGPSGVVVSVPNLLLYEFNLAAPMKTPFEISLPATPVLATVSRLYVILWHAAHVEFRGGFVVYGVNVALALSIGLRT